MTDTSTIDFAAVTKDDIRQRAELNFNFNKYQAHAFVETDAGNVFDASDFLREVLRMAVCECLTVIVIEHEAFYSAHVEVPHTWLTDYGACGDAVHDVYGVYRFDTKCEALAFALDVVAQGMLAPL